MTIHLLVYITSFVLIWIGSGLIVKSVERLSRTLRVSSFVLSFILLGFFTSIGEISVGMNSVIGNDPEIFVGNLIGASIVVFMLIIPLLAILGHTIHITTEFRGVNLPASLIVIALPVILAMDGKIDRIDGVVSVVFYLLLLIKIESNKGVLNIHKNTGNTFGVKTGRELLRTFIGVMIIFVASRLVVDQTIYFSKILHVSPFLISLLLISIGTNIPELSLVIRSIFMKNNQIAFGDYVGSAAMNTIIFGILTLFYGRTIFLSNSYLVSLTFLIVGLTCFYYFARTKNTISRLEGSTILVMYITFVLTEIFIHKDAFLQIIP